MAQDLVWVKKVQIKQMSVSSTNELHTVILPCLPGQSPSGNEYRVGRCNLQHYLIEEGLSVVCWNMCPQQNAFFQMPDCPEQDVYSFFIDHSSLPGTHHASQTAVMIGQEAVANAYFKIPGTAAAYSSNPQGRVKGFQFLLSAGFLKNILLQMTDAATTERILHRPAYLSLQKDLYHKLERLNIARVKDHNPISIFSRKGAIYMILSQLVTTLIQNGHKKLEDPEAEELISLNTALQQDICADIPSIATAARQLHVSTTKLKQLQKKVYQVSFARYHQEQRLAKAKELLLESRKQIKEIAFDLGFNSGNHFARSFRQKFGMPPSGYQKMYCAGNTKGSFGN